MLKAGTPQNCAGSGPVRSPVRDSLSDFDANCVGAHFSRQDIELKDQMGKDQGRGL